MVIDGEDRTFQEMDMGQVEMVTDMLKISVVTICYNEEKEIARTLESVAGQTYRRIEHVVKDGGSTDGTVNIIRQYAKSHLNVIMESSQDGGLYNGMNIGLSKCTGDYVIFCNAGDRFASNDVIEKMVTKAMMDGQPDLVYGDCASETNGELMVRTAHGPRFIKIGMPAAHEAMLYKLSVVRKLDLEYDTDYRIGADYKFTYQFVKAAKSFAYVPIPVVIFTAGGVSTAHQWRGLMECDHVRKEVGGLSLSMRIAIILMQSGVLVFSTFFAPLYRLVRLRKSR